MKYLFFFMLFCCGFACSSHNKIPDDIMGINEMKPLLWDMMRAGTLSQNMKGIDTAAIKKEAINNYEKLFSMYGTNKETFYRSYQYYIEHPDKHKILMDSVVAYANSKRVDLFKRTQ